MRFGKELSRSPSSDTCETLPRSSPAQIMQTTVKRNYQHINKLPIPSNAHLITRLYLSHNNISNLEGIQGFTSLTTLSLSYNKLKNIRQLKRIPNPHLIERISLKMNQFQYGYEDFVVQLFQNLQKLEGISIQQKDKRLQLLRIRDWISKQTLQFFKKTNQVLEIMEEHHNKQNINHCNSKKSKKNLSVYMDSTFFNSLKALYFHPTQDGLRKKGTIFLIKLCQSLIDLVKRTEIHSCESKQYITEDYLRNTQQTFHLICSTILLKFSARHDLTLRNYLQSISAHDSPAFSFSKLGVFEGEQQGMVRIHSLQAQPSQYWPRLENKDVQRHSMNTLVNWNLPQTNTLIESQQTKWHKFYQKVKVTPQQFALYERIPIFIYCRQYLQVFSEVILDQVSKILLFQHQITAESWRAKVQFNKDEQIQLSLSSSGVMSFGRRQQFDQLQPQQEKKPASEGLSFEKIQIGQKKLSQNTISIVPNSLDKYKIYEINLIFKVFRGLKARCKAKDFNSS